MRVPVAVPVLIAASLPASAQDNVQSPPVQTTPRLETFTLPQATPRPTPTPRPIPTVSPTPATPPPVVRTAPTPVAPPTPRPTPTPTGTPSATPTPRATETAVPPVAAATPAPIETPPPAPTATATPAPVPASDGPPWFALIGGALALLAGAVALTLLRRRRPVARTADPVATPRPAPPARPAAPVAPVAAPPPRGVATTLRPLEMWTHGPDAYLKFELVVTNHGADTADAIRVTMALITAGPGVADAITAWQSGADFTGAAAPITLRSGESYVLGGELKLAGEHMHVNDVSDRAMIVPVAMVALRWQGGLSVRRGGDAFVIGTGDAASAKLGPIWVDRAGQRFAKLDARRFEPRG